MMKKSLFDIGAAGVLIAGLASSLVGFPVFAEGPVNIGIVEMVDDVGGGFKPWEDITDATPGMTYSAIPRVRNDGEVVASNVEICLSESGVNVAGERIELDAGTFTININDAYWAKSSEGDNEEVATSPIEDCYKYNTDLAVGELTEPLFYEISLSPELGNEYQNAIFSLHLEAYAIGDGLPSNPDTGVSTNSEPLTVVGYVSLSVGLVMLVGMIIYLLSKKAQKR